MNQNNPNPGRPEQNERTKYVASSTNSPLLLPSNVAAGPRIARTCIAVMSNPMNRPCAEELAAARGVPFTAPQCSVETVLKRHGRTTVCCVGVRVASTAPRAFFQCAAPSFVM